MAARLSMSLLFSLLERFEGCGAYTKTAFSLSKDSEWLLCKSNVPFAIALTMFCIFFFDVFLLLMS